ncbi:similar to Saccharomyces cerevisiae YJL092W SRS2 DNA helicase and DNA-dependent ATPase involved in DNA repair [Maudiozyma saulgeensis]|uniref:DNA 3'-5' helicase n=1 Tax=Maudiozyma saulgeensis TaxID=1789683 RepID=A0A1X7R7Y2_9SACH|nr:similar to Saccharomyces cerevisiae YJL092W SRS2 DNA helicase and DNA-dependent ATPase involved in DNA repair [Kazachstania saulgeensis]
MDTLNAQQKQAVQFDPSAALQVVAGPGTGKTKVLVARVAHLILHYNIPPQNIVVTTFTNKAAMEMKQRLSVLLKDQDVSLNDLIIGTFHSVCLRILMRFGGMIGLPSDWRILDDKETDKIVMDTIQQMPDQIRDYATSFKRTINLCRPSKKNGDNWVVHPKIVKREISRLKSSALLPEEYIQQSTHDEALAYCYSNYQTQMNALNGLDFDDLLMYTFRLLCKHRCLPQIQHVLVDEFQDTNSIQMDLMFLLAKGNHHLSRGITVVGDPDQSIYAFRNALAYNFQQMANKCPLPCSQVILVENYRSSQRILDTSETLINQQQHGRQQRLPLRAQFDCDFPPVYTNFPVSFIQGPSLAKELLYLKALPNLFTYDSFAILVRQRRQIKSIETALIEHRIPYKIVKGHAFWELKEITSMLNLLNCIYSDNDSNAIVSALTYPARGFGQTSASKMLSLMKDKQVNESMSAMETLREVSAGKHNLGMNAKAKSVINKFINMIQSCREKFQNTSSMATTLSEIFDSLYKMSDMENEYLTQDGKENRNNKENSANSNKDANLDNPRHKNIQLLKNYFLETKEVEQLPTDTQYSLPRDDSQKDSPIIEHIRTFFNSLSLFTADNISDSDKQDSRLKEGAVTISTIHGSKGLEWPVVFIPGCIEGIIPSIFQSDNKEDSDSDSSTGGDTSNDKNSKRPTNADESLDEERRMFFVAQTRAKYLLYLSSVEESNSPMFGGPSRFFTPEVMKTLTDEQKALDSISNINKLYRAISAKPEKLNENFSFHTLVKDYSKFVENRRESMIWGGNVLRNLASLDLSRNKLSMATPMSSFTTAAAALKIETNNKKQYAPSYSPTRRTQGERSLQLSPIRKCAPTNNINRSPSPKRQFAPPTRAPESPTKRFAPPPQWNNNVRNPSATGQTSLLESSFSKSSLEERVSDRAGSQFRRNARRITSTPIQLSEVTVSPINNEVPPPRSKFEDTTAAEILHNPDDLTVDNRPIISNARNLANAIRNPISKEKTTKKKKAAVKKEPSKNSASLKCKTSVKKEPIKVKPTVKKESENDLKSTKSRKRVKVVDPSSRVKKEVSSTQVDIFSQLANAKKKAKIDKSEIIILDD